MLKKVLGALVVIVAVAIYLTIREEGADKAFGGVLAPVESVRGGDMTKGREPLASLVTAQSVPNVSQSDYGKMVDSVRSRVGNAMDRSVDRASGRR